MELYIFKLAGKVSGVIIKMDEDRLLWLQYIPELESLQSMSDFEKQTHL